MKFCTKCGKEIHDDAVICIGCGCKTEGFHTVATNKTNELLNTLSQRIHTDAIIWIVIGVLQIVTGIFFIVGIWNIAVAVNDLKYSKDVLNNPVGIVDRYEPVAMPIIIFVCNLVFGGVIGIVGSIYYFIALRGFVMENRAQFVEMEI